MADTTMSFIKFSPSFNAIAADLCERVAKYLRANPTAWGQHVFAKDRYGNSVSPLSRHAHSRCLLGLLEYGTANTEGLRIYMADGFERLIGGSIPAWNDADDRTTEDVIALFERAAEWFANRDRMRMTPNWNELAKPLISFDSIMEKIIAETA
jgi:hypothetical protein